VVTPLHSQGPDAMDTREVSTTVPIEQIPYIMRAIGFYPSEQEVRVHLPSSYAKATATAMVPTPLLSD